ncbi:MAG: MarR family transcriptional regulator [Oscillospiraceae bacterium]|nr:MarR family transcriptional regulator [Oscillospiraceae bacterium]
MLRGYVAVVGAVNVDIRGRSYAGLIPGDSNPGAVHLSMGGVGRNIAHDLRLLEVPVGMLTVLGDDPWADQAEASCRALGIDLSRALRVPGARTGAYLCIAGPDGDMALAVCDTDIAAALTPETLEARLDWLNGAEAVVFDGNLSEESVAFLAERCVSPLFADPVSVRKALRLRPALGRLRVLKPNRLEAEALSGEAEPLEAARALHGMGVGLACVSDGARGLAWADGSGSGRIPCPPTKLVDATGGGDAMMAALVRAHLDGMDRPDALRFALAAASLAVEHPGSIDPALSLHRVRARLAAWNAQSELAGGMTI